MLEDHKGILSLRGIFVMIKLTINPKKENKVFVFNQNEIVIGSSDLSNLLLTDENLSPIHIRIIKENQRYQIYNVANDPFSTLNDLPFGKSYIKDRDIIHLGDISILFELVQSSDIEEKTLKLTPKEEKSSFSGKQQSEKLADLQKIKNKNDNLTFSKPISKQSIKSYEKKYEDDKELELLKEYSIHRPKLNVNSGIESTDYLIDEGNFDVHTDHELEQKDEYDKKHAETYFHFSQDLNFQPEPIISDEGIESHINSFDHVSKFQFDDLDYNQLFNSSICDEKPIEKQSSTGNQEIPSKVVVSKNGKWKIWLSIFIVVISSFGLISNGVYQRLEEKNNHEEIHAARAVSDIALALTYAQIHHIQPHQQNWSDPHFLKNSIYAILTSNHQPLASIDINGRLNGGNYLLRIYMNRDLSRFIVIAQPEPSLMQWLAPQNAVVVDSKSMVLHLVNDLKPLNRLLVNPNSLSGDNGREIFDLVKNEKVLPLKKLVDEENRLGFMPPRQLEIMRLGAENFVYNAPRYSQVGEKLMEQAIDLHNRPGGLNEIKKLQEEISNISRLAHPVLYTSKGMKAALKAQKALAALLPDQKFLIAYLSFDKDGSMKRSHLIIDPDENIVKGISRSHDQDAPEVGSFQPLVIAAKAPDYILSSTQENEFAHSDFPSKIDRNNPLFIKLEEIAKERSEKLSSLSEKFTNLIQMNLNELSQNFSSKLNEIKDEYLSLNENSNQETNEKIEKIYEEYNHIPYAQFENYLNATGLKGFKRKNPISFKKGNLIEINFNQIVGEIIQSDNFKDLNHVTAKAYNFLKLENIPDSSLLIRYQHQLRNAVLEKLNEMILSSRSDYYLEESSVNDKNLISQILMNAWVVDSEEQNYYLQEYDRIFN